MSDPLEAVHPATEPEPEDLESRIMHQDTYRKVMFGEISDPLVPLHPGPPEAEEDALARAAMEDPAAHTLQMADPRPTLWRLVALMTFAILALCTVFWWMR